MLRSVVFRAARLPRAGLSGSTVLATVRPAVLQTGSTAVCGVALRPLSRPVVARLANVFAGRRLYSATSEAVETKNETQDQGALTRFVDLSSLGVHENVVSSITNGMGYETMTPVQAKTIVPALEGKDLVAQAKTGTGKTLAFLVPVIQKIITENPNLAFRGRVRASSRDIRAIILSPTRELAEQISKEARELCRSTGVVVQTAVGGTQKRAMLAKTQREGCHILVATPGRLYDVLSTPGTGIDAPRLSALVLDEADRMLDVGFDKELQDIVRLLPSRASQPRQTMLFSATIPRDVVSLARSYVDPQNFEFVQTISRDEQATHERVPQHLVPVRSYENLYPTLLELITRERQACQTEEDQLPFKAIVFLPTTNFVQLTAMAFRNLGHTHKQLPEMFHIHSKLSQAGRTAAADRFRRASSAILFSSDVTARGMDFPNVSHVIQVGMPPDRDQYIHRLGRTGRANRGGQGWMLVPRWDVEAARDMLVDLPLRRADGLACATHDATTRGDADGEDSGAKLGTGAAATPAAYFLDVKEAMRRLPRDLMSDTYMSCFGGHRMGRSAQQLLDGLNDWAVHGWGWAEPPAVPQRIAQLRGLTKLRGIRIAESGSWGRSERSGHYGEDSFERVFSQSAQGGSDRGGSDRGFSRSDRGGSRSDRGSSRSDQGFSRSDRGHSRSQRGGGGGGYGPRGNYSPNGRNRMNSSF